MRILIMKKFCLLFFFSFLLSFASSSRTSTDESIFIPTCDVAVGSAICIHGGQKMLLPDAKPYGLITHIDFDSSLPVDNSGETNHAMGKTLSASGIGGIGSSGFFRQNYITIPSNESLETSDFSYTFFVFLLKDDKSISSSLMFNQYCPIIHKGTMQNGVEEATPAILVNPRNGRIKVVVSTSSTSSSAGEEMESNSKLKAHQWYHIAVVRHLTRVRLYIDGILDSSFVTDGATRLNDLPVYIGGAPYAAKSCDVPILLDELRIYSIGIGRDQIQAEAAVTLGGVEPSFITIGCIDCTKEKAENICPADYHLCNKIELYSGGYHVARKLSLGSNIISADAGGLSNGLALCCADSNI